MKTPRTPKSHISYSTSPHQQTLLPSSFFFPWCAYQTKFRVPSSLAKKPRQLLISNRWAVNHWTCVRSGCRDLWLDRETREKEGGRTLKTRELTNERFFLSAKCQVAVRKRSEKQDEICAFSSGVANRVLHSWREAGSFLIQHRLESLVCVLRAEAEGNSAGEAVSREEEVLYIVGVWIFLGVSFVKKKCWPRNGQSCGLSQLSSPVILKSYCRSPETLRCMGNFKPLKIYILHCIIRIVIRCFQVLNTFYN